MTFEALAKQIMEMTPEQRQRPAVIAMQQTGEVAEVEELSNINDFNGIDLPNQKVLWYNNHDDPSIY